MDNTSEQTTINPELEIDKPKRNVLETPTVSFILMCLIVFSVVSYSLETLPDLPPAVANFLQTTEILIVTLFSCEYLHRLYTSRNRIKFVFSFYGIIDLIAILPFFLSFVTIDLRALRLLRMLRLLRLFKLARYNAALLRMREALIQAREELVIAITMLAIIIYLGAYGIYQFEHHAQPEKFASIIDALWWSVATVTTVGYGDIYPITIGGRIFTFVVMIASLGIVSVPAGIFATALLSVTNKTNKVKSE